MIGLLLPWKLQENIVTMDTMDIALSGVSASFLADCRSQFEADKTCRLARNVCSKHNVLDILRDSQKVDTSSHVFQYKVEQEGKPVTNQKASGRCWIFAYLNCARQPFMKKHNLEDFEFSQNYLYFWDKVERFHFLLHAFIDTARRGEKVDDRLVQHLLFNPSEDGGQWHMLVNVVEKYGVMPKKCFPDSWSAETSRRFNMITNNKMREYCLKIRDLVNKGVDETDLKKEVDLMTAELYRIISVCVGTPPETFTWEYYDKNKKYNKVGPITPLDFYKEYVKPVANMEDKVVLVNDPRPGNSYGKLYTVEYLGNMVNGRKVLYINQEIVVLKKLAAMSIKDNESVWFGCDVNQHCSWRKGGVLDVDQYDYDLVLQTSVLNLDKAQRLQYRESLMTHAMVLTALSEGDDGKSTKWRVENSWGESEGDKGYLVMTDHWFSEFVYEVVVDKKYLPSEILDILKDEPIVLPAWDPMGALAKAKL